MTELQSMEYWEGIITPQDSLDKWQKMAIIQIARLAHEPEKYDIGPDAANAIRILYAAVPEELLVQVAKINNEFANAVQTYYAAKDEMISEIEEFLKEQ